MFGTCISSQIAAISSCWTNSIVRPSTILRLLWCGRPPVDVTSSRSRPRTHTPTNQRTQHPNCTKFSRVSQRRRPQLTNVDNWCISQACNMNTACSAYQILWFSSPYLYIGLDYKIPKHFINRHETKLRFGKEGRRAGFSVMTSESSSTSEGASHLFLELGRVT